METIVRPTPAAVKAPATKQPAAAAKAQAPGRMVDVALFRNLPGAGTPLVSAADDKTLGSMDPIAAGLSKLETKGPMAAKVVAGARLATRVVGPIMWGASVVFNVKLLAKAIKDPTISAGSKAALIAGTVTNAVGAVCSAVCALPVKAAAMVGLGKTGLMTANKLAGLFGGIGGTIFNTINMVETLRKPGAKPAERFFAKAGFALGVLGFVASTVALTASLPWMAGVVARMPALLPVATKAANWLGIAGLAVFIGQVTLGKNQWLGKVLKGTPLG